MRRTYFIALALLAGPLALLPAAAWASPEGEHHGGGLTLFSHPVPMISDEPVEKVGLVWLLLNFAILMWILNRLLFRPLRKGTEEKHATVKQQVEAAKIAREEAEGVMAEYKARLARLDDEIEELMADARARAEADRARILAHAKSEAERIREQAQHQAEREAKLLRDELEGEIVDQAIARAEEALRRAFTDADQRKLVGAYVEQVRSTPLAGGPQ